MAESICRSEAGLLQQDGIEVVDVEGETDGCRMPRLRELLIDIVNMEKVGFLDSPVLACLSAA